MREVRLVCEANFSLYRNPRARLHRTRVAWAFDKSRAMVQPEPVTVGGSAPFLKNGASADFQIVPANPGFFQMFYLADRCGAIFKKLSAEQQIEIRKDAGAFYLNIWIPEDTTDWRARPRLSANSMFSRASFATSKVPLFVTSKATLLCLSRTGTDRPLRLSVFRSNS